MTYELGSLVLAGFTLASVLVHLGISIQILREHGRRIKELEDWRTRHTEGMLAKAAGAGA